LPKGFHLLRLAKLIFNFLAPTDLLDQSLIGHRQLVAGCCDRCD
jgi:hypothetical protein